ncbi:MAG: VCBS repeat-containing protein, partial [Bacteroidetes bacterium]|nr:VCBS repeat-containing protein [Bacteroidota bacterium]
MRAAAEIGELAAGIEGDGWCTGVTMADVNADGFLDIYVCRSYDDDNPQKRGNLLFINNGDQTFTERGEEYGLNDISHSTQATFFDYDLDGDMDVYVINNPRWHVDEARFEKQKNPQLEESDKLFRNDGNNHFKDVTIESGIINFGFSLGLAAADVNNDGYPDIYVSVDHSEPDYFYINNGNGTFTNSTGSSLKHISNFGMGMDLADFNNDGLIDIVVVDMMAEDNFRQKTQMKGMSPKTFWNMVDHGYHYQYMRNTLQLNNGNGTYSEIGLLAGITSTDWSWSTLMADFDNDGLKDIFVSNGFRKGLRDNDFLIEVKKMKVEAKKTSEHVDIYEIEEMMPTGELLSNYLFKNNGDLTFREVTTEFGLTDQAFSYGAAYGDLDNDGDLDLIINNLDDQTFVYRNNATDQLENNYLRIHLKGSGNNKLGIGAKVTIEHGNSMQYQELTLTRGFQSSVENRLHFGLGTIDKVDRVKVVWPDGKQQILNNVEVNILLVIDQSDANIPSGESLEQVNLLFSELTTRIGISFTHKENDFDDFEKEILLPHKMSQFGPNIAVGDVNHDGLDDFYVGGASEQAGSLYIQNEDATFTEISGTPFERDRICEDIGAVLFDSDNDGDLDLYVVSGGNEFDPASKYLQDRLYLNDGLGNFTKSKSNIPEMISSGSCVVPGDYDGDGDMDLFIGGRVVPGRYPFAPSSYILNNEGGIFSDVTEEIAPGLSDQGLVTSAIWTDFDNDGSKDLIVVGEWMPISFYHNNSGKFENKTEEFGFGNSTGWWNKIIEGDFDKDGDMDYVAGNLGLNYKYTATVEEPLHIYCYDFDRSGTFDIVLGYYNGGTCYPVRGRQCSSQHMPFIPQKFPNYNSFGSAP